jgi:hypothetical protein
MSQGVVAELAQWNRHLEQVPVSLCFTSPFNERKTHPDEVVKKKGKLDY